MKMMMMRRRRKTVTMTLECRSKAGPLALCPPSQIKPPDRRIKPGRTAATLTTVRSVSHQTCFFSAPHMIDCAPHSSYQLSITSQMSPKDSVWSPLWGQFGPIGLLETFLGNVGSSSENDKIQLVFGSIVRFDCLTHPLQHHHS